MMRMMIQILIRKIKLNYTNLHCFRSCVTYLNNLDAKKSITEPVNLNLKIYPKIEKKPLPWAKNEPYLPFSFRYHVKQIVTNVKMHFSNIFIKIYIVF